MATETLTPRAVASPMAARIRSETLRDRPGAAAIYEELLALDPTHAEALRFRGDYLFEQGQLEGAVELYARMEESENARDIEDFDVRRPTPSPA